MNTGINNGINLQLVTMVVVVATTRLSSQKLSQSTLASVELPSRTKIGGAKPGPRCWIFSSHQPRGARTENAFNHGVLRSTIDRVDRSRQKNESSLLQPLNSAPSSGVKQISSHSIGEAALQPAQADKQNPGACLILPLIELGSPSN